MFNFDNDINEIMEELIVIRRYIHQNPELGFELYNTVEFVKDKLYSYGYKPYICGKCGVVCEINTNKEKTILLRADMDGLPIKEETELPFRSDKNMHACGHDIHTTILLGVAKILKKYESDLKCNIRFMFQPAEEILEGAQDMISDGVLDNIDEAYMIHILVPTEYETGTIIISDNKNVAPSCDYFDIKVIGKEVHGAMPLLGIDPIMISSEIVNDLKHIGDDFTLTFGMINGGATYNIIPDKVHLKGTFRTLDEDVRIKVKENIFNITNNISNKYSGNVEIDFPTSAPVLINDLKLFEKVYNILTLNNINTIKTSELAANKAAGSEDFAYVSQMVPSLMISLCSGNETTGCLYPLHNNKLIIDEKSIYYGVLVFLNIALMD